MLARTISNPFEALFRNATVGIIVVSASGKILMANAFALRMFGYTKKQLVGQHLNLLIPERYHRKHNAYHRSYFRKPESRPMGKDLKLFALTRKGAEIPVEISLGYYRLEEESYVIAVISNKSEKLRREEQIRQLNLELEKTIRERTSELNVTVNALNEKMEDVRLKDEAIRSANEYLTNILDNLSAIVIVTDENGIIRLLNAFGEKSLGYEADKLVGKASPALFCKQAPTSHTGTTTNRVPKHGGHNGFESLVRGKVKDLPAQEEWLCVRKDGSEFPVSLSVTAIPGKGQKPGGYLCIASDITKQKRIEDELWQSLQKEKELGELKSRFVSLASHEFRTPLSTILSSVYLLSKYTQTEEQPKREKHINRIESSINTLNDILNDFLSMGRIEEGRVQPKFSRFPIREFIHTIVREMQPVLKPGQHINYRHSGDTWVLLDESILKNIMVNLLSNAIKFSTENAAIDIYTSASDEALRLTIRDRGIGVPVEDQPHLFERFFRARNAEHIKGTGLGLHIVAKYTEMLHGVIQFESEADKGTAFHLSFKLN